MVVFGRAVLSDGFDMLKVPARYRQRGIRHGEKQCRLHRRVCKMVISDNGPERALAPSSQCLLYGRRLRYSRRRLPGFVGYLCNKACYVVTVEFDLNAVGALRILATVLPYLGAGRIRLDGVGCAPGLAEQGLDLHFGGLAWDHFIEGCSGEVPRGSGVRPIVSTMANRRRERAQRNCH